MVSKFLFLGTSHGLVGVALGKDSGGPIQSTSCLAQLLMLLHQGLVDFLIQCRADEYQVRRVCPPGPLELIVVFFHHHVVLLQEPTEYGDRLHEGCEEGGEVPHALKGGKVSGTWDRGTRSVQVLSLHWL